MEKKPETDEIVIYAALFLTKTHTHMPEQRKRRRVQIFPR